MNKINPKSIHGLGNLIRRKTVQLHDGARQVHNSGTRFKPRSGSFRPALKTRRESTKEGEVSRFSRRQESLTRDFSRALFMKTQFPFVEKNTNDDFSSKDLLNYEPILNPLESNEVPINAEIRDINYAEERPNRKDLARSSVHSTSSLSQKTKLLSKFKGVKVNQSRSASTYEQNDAGSATGNKQHDQSQYKANKKQYASANQKIEQSRSGRRKYDQLQDIPPSSKVSSKGPKGPTTSKQTMYKKNDSLSRSEQQVTMPSIFSIQTKPFPAQPIEKRFVFRRSYSTRSTSPIRMVPKHYKNYSTKSTSTPCPPPEPGESMPPYRPPECAEDCNDGDTMPPRFFYTKKDTNKRCMKEICTSGTPPDIARKVCTRSYSSKCGKKDHCSKKQPKTCPNIKPRGSCSDNLSENPCGEVRPKNEICGNKPPICGNKPTRQDCETD